jgi:hypothetical protein
VPGLSLSGTSRPASISSRRNQPRPKNKFAKRGKFSGVEKHRKTYHVSPATHHTFTIKKPRSAPRFSQNPQQKRTSPHNKKNQKAKSVCGGS